MCRCNYDNRQPYCGMPGCEWPSEEERKKWERYESQRLQYELREAHERRRPRPDELFLLGQQDVLVQAHLKAWLAGDFSFEQCLLSLIGAMSARHKETEAHVLSLMQRCPPPFLIKTEKQP